MEQEQSKFEGWAIVELFGHQREAGYVSIEVYGVAVLFRVDVPELPERETVLDRPEWVQREPGGETEYTPVGSKVKRAAVPARSRLIGPGAIYAINPCTEEAARLVVDGMDRSPLILLESPKSAALPASGLGLEVPF